MRYKVTNSQKVFQNEFLLKQKKLNNKDFYKNTFFYKSKRPSTNPKKIGQQKRKKRED